MTVVEELRAAVSSKKLVVLVARCTVTYEGRASSKLGEGDRVILIKEDGSVIVHRPVGYEPVNYQPPGSVVSVEGDDDGFRIIVTRTKRRERLLIEVHSVKHFFSAKLEDSARFTMWGDEEDLRRAILADPSRMLGENLKPVGAEVSLGSAGFADAVFVDSEGNLVVVEVKREKASVEAVYQLKRYVERIKRETGRKVRGILAAPGFTVSAIRALKAEGLEYRQVSMKDAREVLSRLTAFW